MCKRRNNHTKGDNARMVYTVDTVENIRFNVFVNVVCDRLL